MCVYFDLSIRIARHTFGPVSTCMYHIAGIFEDKIFRGDDFHKFLHFYF